MQSIGKSTRTLPADLSTQRLCGILKLVAKRAEVWPGVCHRLHQADNRPYIHSACSATALLVSPKLLGPQAEAFSQEKSASPLETTGLVTREGEQVPVLRKG